MKPLYVDSSIPGVQSASRQLMAEIVDLSTKADPTAKVIYDFLAADVIVIGAYAAQINAGLDRRKVPG